VNRPPVATAVINGGTCGKSPEVNAVQDLLVYCLRGLASVVLQAREAGLPAFITLNVLKFLSDTYHLQPITTPEQDLAACLA
jgi:hydroxylamine reductase (hybrid-cluster protein)